MSSGVGEKIQNRGFFRPKIVINSVFSFLLLPSRFCYNSQPGNFSVLITLKKVRYLSLLYSRETQQRVLVNYYFDIVLKICSEEIDRKFPDGWGLSFDYRIPGECTNREQRRLKKMHGTEFFFFFLTL